MYLCFFLGSTDLFEFRYRLGGSFTLEFPIISSASMVGKLLTTPGMPLIVLNAGLLTLSVIYILFCAEFLVCVFIPPYIPPLPVSDDFDGDVRKVLSMILILLDKFWIWLFRPLLCCDKLRRFMSSRASRNYICTS
jgi:hypothetical protein